MRLSLIVDNLYPASLRTLGIGFQKSTHHLHILALFKRLQNMRPTLTPLLFGRESDMSLTVNSCNSSHSPTFDANHAYRSATDTLGHELTDPHCSRQPACDVRLVHFSAPVTVSQRNPTDSRPARRILCARRSLGVALAPSARRSRTESTLPPASGRSSRVACPTYITHRLRFRFSDKRNSIEDSSVIDKPPSMASPSLPARTLPPGGRFPARPFEPVVPERGHRGLPEPCSTYGDRHEHQHQTRTCRSWLSRDGNPL